MVIIVLVVQFAFSCKSSYSVRDIKENQAGNKGIYKTMKKKAEQEKQMDAKQEEAVKQLEIPNEVSSDSISVQLPADSIAVIPIAD